MIQPQPAFTLHLRFQPFSSFVPKWAQALDPPRILRLYNTYLSNTLDPHQVWLSHDPTSVQTFVEKGFTPPFFILFKKTQLLVLCICFLGSLSHLLKRRNFTAQSSSSWLSILLPVIHPVIWCFPIWLTSSLSYPMAIFSANEILTFLDKFCPSSRITW